MTSAKSSSCLRCEAINLTAVTASLLADTAIFVAVTASYSAMTIQYNTKFVKRHVAVASEALANRTVKKHRRGRTNVL